jgi:hypothetical protein
MAEEVTDRHVATTRIIQRSHDIRSDKTGASGHQQHDIPALIMRRQLCLSPARQATWTARLGEDRWP